MHKLIRLAALFTLSINNEQENLVQSGEALVKPMDVECWKNKRWISLVDSKMNAISDQPNCQTLSTLFFQKNPNLIDIPQEFFKYMQGLRVLNLYDTGITSLPQSFLNLVTLKVLCLQECVALVELPLDTIKFQNLEVLDVHGSGLAHIPPQVKNLNCLKRLLISFTRLSSSSHIQEAPNDIEVISKIPMLRELVIDVKEGEAIVLYELIVEVFKLTILSLLQFCFPKKVVNLIQAMGGNWKINFPAEILITEYISKADSLELKKCQIFFGCDISSHPHIMKFMPYFKFDGKVSDNGSKIVFTIRLRHVYFSIATRQANVATLNTKESLDMFKTVFDDPMLVDNYNIRRLMPLIVSWCGYHPLMIKVVAGVFRVKETEESWHDGGSALYPEDSDIVSGRFLESLIVYVVKLNSLSPLQFCSPKKVADLIKAMEIQLS
ncbi:hypothetical protein LXL04_016998 [Taraxacum kok-saghyz]